MIFVFGSNLAGRHGRGAARTAYHVYKAQYGVGIGPTGNAYAIPTKGFNLEVLSLDKIKQYIDNFLVYAENNPDKTFYVTPVGTGLAGYSISEIAPFFRDAPTNCQFPGDWNAPHPD